MISEQEAKDLSEIQRLLDEAYDHYFKYSDGYCKSSEGHIALNFNHYFERRDGEAPGIKSVEIYSYVFGPSRLHTFASTADALGVVKVWHDREMQETYEEPDWGSGEWL
ncbi:hypothetical protein [Streptomyces globisporus]|uniref:hypothetical protein n=1 Tax=Streptomyces globisporus TaxID=1908 RepID=UPI003693ECB7